MTTKSNEKRLQDLEEKTDEILELLRSMATGLDLQFREGEFNRTAFADAIDKAFDGNTKALDLYKKRGGIIPVGKEANAVGSGAVVEDQIKT